MVIWDVQANKSFGGELASLLSDHDEEVEDLLLGELAGTVSVDLAESLVKLVFGELGVCLGVLAVHVHGHLLDLSLLELTRAVLIKSGEDSINEFTDLGLSD